MEAGFAAVAIVVAEPAFAVFDIEPVAADTAAAVAVASTDWPASTQSAGAKPEIGCSMPQRY